MADWDDEEIFENEDCYDEEGMNEDCYDEHGMPMNRGMHVEQIKVFSVRLSNSFESRFFNMRDRKSFEKSLGK